MSTLFLFFYYDNQQFPLKVEIDSSHLNTPEKSFFPEYKIEQ